MKHDQVVRLVRERFLRDRAQQDVVIRALAYSSHVHKSL